jgi:hypothetical protein
MILAEIQRMALIVLDDELPGATRRVMDVPDQADPVPPARLCRGVGVVGFEVEVEVFARVGESNGRILLVDELQVKKLIACPDAGVEIRVLEDQGQP